MTPLSRNDVITELVTTIIAGEVEGSTDIPAVLAECYTRVSVAGRMYYKRKDINIIDSVRRNTK
nr:MAG TPA: hypothetical protein [Caudoviricetes sp.]